MVEIIHSLNDALSRRKELNSNIEKLKSEYDENNKKLTEKLEATEQIISDYNSFDSSRAALGKTYIKDPWATQTSIMKSLVDYMTNLINEGRLPELARENKNVSYWYNSGFNDGHVREISNGYGEDYAVSLGDLRLTADLYESPENIGDETILAILAYLETLNYDLTHYDLAEPYVDRKFKFNSSNKVYPIWKYTGEDPVLVYSTIGVTEVPYDTKKLNNWLFKQGEVI